MTDETWRMESAASGRNQLSIFLSSMRSPVTLTRPVKIATMPFSLPRPRGGSRSRPYSSCLGSAAEALRNGARAVADRHVNQLPPPCPDSLSWITAFTPFCPLGPKCPGHLLQSVPDGSLCQAISPCDVEVSNPLARSPASLREQKRASPFDGQPRAVIDTPRFSDVLIIGSHDRQGVRAPRRPVLARLHATTACPRCQYPKSRCYCSAIMSGLTAQGKCPHT